ncbi:glycosyltransferase family 39 protein [Paraflavisolibacter sp. H34]|uniref:ArnT family glycosyltransferase n=1 Tax=Huijunlia imazamoxiresistens TaxID=3127457 RepID=UPI003017B019
MNTTFLSANTYRALFGLLAVVYVTGLFVPLMDNDSAHHADIALRMYLTGDFVNLVDHGTDYLDKPHLHFWLAALSYHVFGVTSFAYKFPSFLFTLLGIYATYRLGSTLYNKEVGRLAALIVSSSFAFILANNDVRMDAILTSSIVFATWQLADWVNTRRLVNVAGAALGLALGFCTKGHIAVATPAAAAFFYILYKKDWKSFYNGQLLLIIAFFFLFISPVVYCYYLQYDLHPEKVVRGRSGISGVKFILWQQNVERFEGESFGSDRKNDYFFFLHSFLWAFAPWSLLGFAAYFSRLKSFVTRRYEWLTISTFTLVLAIISLSGFKLPHYLNITFPVASVFTASYLLHHRGNPVLLKRFAVTQAIVCTLLLLLAGLVNAWAFPLHNIGAIIGFLGLLAAGYFLLKSVRGKLQQVVVASAVTIMTVFFLLNANFYPQLLTYQAGNELAATVNKEIGAENLYFYNTQSWSLNFYTRRLTQPFSDSLLDTGKKVWVVTMKATEGEIKERYQTGRQYRRKDYEITRLKGDFLNPATRDSALDQMVITEVLGRK